MKRQGVLELEKSRLPDHLLLDMIIFAHDQLIFFWPNVSNVNPFILEQLCYSGSICDTRLILSIYPQSYLAITLPRIVHLFLFIHVALDNKRIFFVNSSFHDAGRQVFMVIPIIFA